MTAQAFRTLATDFEVIQVTGISDSNHAVGFGNRPKSKQFDIWTENSGYSSVTSITNPGDPVHGVFRLPLAS